ncbi:MAG: thiosulfate oxidation carrier protein SoxY [Dechloromonas sp.]|nr:thiosulfate oxidation carrier protein SoxY [Dechloromonas sp.]
MNELRRKLLQGSTAALFAPWIGAGLLVPRRVIAAEWNRAAFTARNVNEALKAWGAANAAESRDIVINAPEIAENGAKVEIDITSQIPASRSIAIFVDRNPMPLCAAITFSGGALPYCRAQLKLAESTRIRAVVKAGDGKTYVAFREIKVTLGGCGG